MSWQLYVRSYYLCRYQCGTVQGKQLGAQRSLTYGLLPVLVKYPENSNNGFAVLGTMGFDYVHGARQGCLEELFFC